MEPVQANAEQSAASAAKAPGAPQAPVTLEALRDAINAQGLKFNQLLNAFQESDERLATAEQNLREMQALVRDMSLRPQGAVSGAGGPIAGTDVQVQLTQLAADVADLKSRPVGAVTVAEQKKISDASMRRESQAHQGDRMVYHSDPQRAKVAIVVATDAELKAAKLAGYHESLEIAARFGLAPDVTKLEQTDPQAFQAQLWARMEQIKKGMFKVA